MYSWPNHKMYSWSCEMRCSCEECSDHPYMLYATRGWRLHVSLQRYLSGDQVEGPERLLAEEGRLPLEHLDHHDAQTPDVHLASTSLHVSAFCQLTKQPTSSDAQTQVVHLASTKRDDIIRKTALC